MVELKKLTIKKQLYEFEVRKRFQYVRRYRLKEVRPIDKLIRSFSSAFGKRKKDPVKTRLATQPGSNKFVFYGFLFVAIMILVVGGLYVVLQGIRTTETYATRATLSPQLDFEFMKSGIITAGSKEAPANVAYLQFSYIAKGMDKFNISIWSYQFSVPSQVFILRSAMDKSQTSSYPDFKAAMKKELWNKKISVNEIDLEQVETLPSGAILIVPTGYIPQQLLGVDSNFDIKKLIERGVVIIYMGYPFDHMLTPQESIIAVPQETKSALPFVFSNEQKFGPTSLAIEGPFYSAKLSVQNFENFQIYGVISVVKKGDGAILFVPQSLDSGWGKNGVAAANDLSKIILASAWVTPDKPFPAVYSFNESVENATVSEFFSLPFEGNLRYIKIDISGVDLNNDPVGEMRILKVKKGPKGSLYVQGGVSVVSSEVSGSPVKLFANLKEPVLGKKLLYLSFSRNGKEILEKQLANTNPLSLQVETQIIVPIQLDTGSYIASLVDDEGKIYAQSLLHVVFVNVKRVLPDAKEREVFRFAFEKEGQPVVLEGVEVKVTSASGQGYGTYLLNKTSSPTIDVSKNVLGDTRLPYGKYTFTFKIGAVKKEVPVDLTSPENIFLSPPFIAVAVFSLLIIAIGAYFARSESVFYQLDVPDFPPVSKTKIQIKHDTVLSVFEKVNDDYKWKHTPITVQEIKNGFRKVFFAGKPIFISDYNVEFIMEKMIRKKLVHRFLDYYAPFKWEGETGHSIRYLGVFRKLRDIFVNNAVPFSLFGEERDCDTKMDLMGQQMFLHIFDKCGDLKKLVSNILTTSKLGISIVVFRDVDEKSDFRDMLSSASPVSAALKLEVETNAVQLMDVVELEEMIKEMKSV